MRIQKQAEQWPEGEVGSPHHIYGSHPYEDEVRRRKERMDEEYDPEVDPPEWADIDHPRWDEPFTPPSTAGWQRMQDEVMRKKKETGDPHAY